MSKPVDIRDLTCLFFGQTDSESSGIFGILHGPPDSRKSEIALSLAMNLAGEGIMVHYIDSNFSLVPEYFLSELHEEDELPIRIYRPRDPAHIEKLLEFLSSHTSMHPECVIMDSLILMGRTALLRHLEVDPVYVFALIRKFSMRPRMKGLALVETRMSDVSEASVIMQFKRHIDFFVKSTMMASGSLSILVSKPMDADTKRYRLEPKDLPTAVV